jgi:hypothetical protein
MLPSADIALPGYRTNTAGEKLDCVRIDNEPMRFAEEVAHAPVGSEVVIEATYGWYWAADLLQELGPQVHLAHSRGNEWRQRRVKNDGRDATDRRLGAPRGVACCTDRSVQHGTF